MQVSIITPSLNRADWIQATLDSVRCQDYADIEHIVVDGGSADGTLDILKANEGSYNLRWVCEHDEGMYQAINKGLRLAKGDVLAYLNTDDLYFPWTVAAIVDAFQRYPETGIIYGDLLNYNVSTGRFRLLFFPPYHPAWVRRVGVISQPTAFWRREVLSRVGAFDEHLKLLGDIEYWMRAGERVRILHLQEFLAIERDHPDALRFRKADQMVTEDKLIRGRYTQNETPLVCCLRSGFWRLHNSAWYRIDLFRFAWALFWRVNGAQHASGLGPWQRMIASRYVKLRDKRGVCLLLVPGVDKDSPFVFGDQLQSLVHRV